MGKWKYDHEEGIVSEGGYGVCAVYPRNRKANGPILAAAPDMLAALEKIDSQLDTLNTETLFNLALDDAKDRIQRAILKARGL